MTSCDIVDPTEFDPPTKNDYYLMGIESNRIGYLVEASPQATMVHQVTIHGEYIGFGEIEVEVSDFEIETKYEDDAMRETRYILDLRPDPRGETDV